MSDQVYDSNQQYTQAPNEQAKQPLIQNQQQYNPYPQIQQQQQNYNPPANYAQPVAPPPYAQDFYSQQQQVVLIRPQNADGFRTPIVLQCPYCKQEGVTRTEFRIGNGTICCTVLICVFFGIFFLIPLLIDSCRDVVHLCPYCSQMVGIAKYEPCS